MLDIESHYKTIAPKLTNYLVANGTSYALACDIVQETFLKIWKMRESVVDEPEQVSGLAYTIARNLRTDKYRKSSRETLQEEITDEDAGAVGPGASPSDNAYLRRRIVKALGELPPLLREAYTLFQVQELSIRKIAEVTGATEASVKVRIFRAKEKLQIALRDLQQASA